MFRRTQRLAFAGLFTVEPAAATDLARIQLFSYAYRSISHSAKRSFGNSSGVGYADTAILVLIFAQYPYHRRRLPYKAMVATAAGEKLLIGCRPVKNWTQLQFFSLFHCELRVIGNLHSPSQMVAK